MTTIPDDAFVRLFQERAGLGVDGVAGPAILDSFNLLPCDMVLGGINRASFWHYIKAKFHG